MKAQKSCSRLGLIGVLIFFAGVALLFCPSTAPAADTVGVLYVVHGGFDEYYPQHLWDCSVQMFAYRPDHIVHKSFVWNSGNWNGILQFGNAPKEVPKYAFEYERLGGTDPFGAITASQLAQLESDLNATSCYGNTFVVDYASWMAGDSIEHWPYPRFMLNPPSYITLPPISPVNYCGEYEANNVVLDFDEGSVPFTVGARLTGQTTGATAVIQDVSVTSGSWALGTATGTLSIAGLTYTAGSCAASGNPCTTNAQCAFLETCLGHYFAVNEIIIDDNATAGAARANGQHHWPNCDKDRYDVDGPVERFLAAGVDKIVVVDMTTGGTRFFKTYNVVQMVKRALDDYGASIPVEWANDPNNLMERSYPTSPVGISGIWTPDLLAITTDSSIALASNPNPVISDTMLAQLHVEGIEANFSPSVPDNQTAVLILNHATSDWHQYFDPKINDTLSINENIKSLLLSRHPKMDPDYIIGAYMGIKYGAPDWRTMRGENIGHAWMYEQPNGTLPGEEWGYRYWNALEYLKNIDGGKVQHVVIGFPQIVSDSVLNMVEIHNQIGKEIGRKNWLKWDTGDNATYPGVGHPFADYWGVWAATQCYTEEPTACCFEMGGCASTTGRPYPPPSVPIYIGGSLVDDLNPHYAYDVSAYGHLGYDEDGSSGAPSEDYPVQDQYDGTWAMYSPPNDDPRLAEVMAKYVIRESGCPYECVANATGDTKVNLTDLGKLKSEFGRTNCVSSDPGKCCVADFDDNGKVNLTDLGKLKGEFGRTNCSVAPAPCTF